MLFANFLTDPLKGSEKSGLMMAIALSAILLMGLFGGVQMCLGRKVEFGRISNLVFLFGALDGVVTVLLLVLNHQVSMLWVLAAIILDALQVFAFVSIAQKAKQ